ncbi:MSMEG_4193 family putative phosphomutase [Streptomonospora sp. S1-112]|uniref:MSMEG_4193 family putative phosphomutase n=1 Tax=Streptomonospora mangrovi TaxID=2883123 RepID=A0A9X3SQL4_9ACTN|nr:MSMEG_4193 family putative phosphomutase [Streptomonospora mangrovi]MDA0566696.1 MSMEG_4193 family putative phosphomutase [Streptomonospora mangrovi]
MGNPSHQPAPPEPAERPADAPPPEPVATLLLVRHGLTAVTGATLTGRAPGVHLDERGRAQAADLAARLAGLDLAAIVASPLERCQETAAAIAEATGRPVATDAAFTECDYGEWTGRALTDLAREPLWRTVQAHPSAARFPGGEAMTEMSARAVAGVRAWNRRLTAESAAPVYVVCSHGDVIKAITADALGLHLDQFQRIQADPCSLTAIRYTAVRPFVLRLNDVGGSVAGLVPAPEDASGEAAVGGGAGGARTARPGGAPAPAAGPAGA